MDLKTIIKRLREQEEKRKRNELASLNADVNVFNKKAPSSTQNNTVKELRQSGQVSAMAQ